MRAPAAYAEQYHDFGTAFTKTVTTPGTQLQITSTETIVKGCYIQALPTNAKRVVVAGSNADYATFLGFALQAYDYMFIPISDLSRIWIDAEAAGEGVSVIPVR